MPTRYSSIRATWDFPEGQPIADADKVSYVLYSHKYGSCQEEGKDPANDVHIFYKGTLLEAGDVQSKVKETAKEETLPNSLLVPIYEGAKAKVGDVVLTWWQSGSGMQRAIVTDASDPAEPKVDYLDLNYKGDGTGIAEKDADEKLKPNSFNVLEDGKWMPGMPICAGDEKRVGTILSVTDDKVLYEGFAGKVYAEKKSNCKLLPLNPSISAGDKVEADFVGKFRDGYTVTKVDKKIGRVWLKDENGKEEIVSILSVKK